LDHKSIGKFDLRLREKFLKDGTITIDQINKDKQSLEDQSDNMQEIILADDESSELDDQVAE